MAAPAPISQGTQLAELAAEHVKRARLISRLNEWTRIHRANVMYFATALTAYPYSSEVGDKLCKRMEEIESHAVDHALHAKIAFLPARALRTFHEHIDDRSVSRNEIPYFGFEDSAPYFK